jgi:hypothetical protein
VGNGFFEDMSVPSGVGEPTFIPLSWGTALVDLDNDGDLDLVVANGHIYPQVDGVPDALTYRQKNLLLENVGRGRFSDVTSQAGPGFGIVQSSRGLAAGDYDNDGDLDLLLTHLDEAPSLLRNDSTSGSWLTVICEVTPGEGTAIGTEVTVTVGDKKMIRDLASSESYVSVHDPRLHFGLGGASRADRIEVRWPDGTRTVRENVPANAFLKVRKNGSDPENAAPQ